MRSLVEWSGQACAEEKCDDGGEDCDAVLDQMTGVRAPMSPVRTPIAATVPAVMGYIQFSVAADVAVATATMTESGEAPVRECLDDPLLGDDQPTVVRGWLH
jgi:hypothetical protein